MTGHYWENLDRAATAYRDAAAASGACAEARALLDSLRARSQPVFAFLEDKAKDARPDERGVVFAFKADNTDAGILRAREVKITAGFARVTPGTDETPVLDFNDSTMTIVIAHHEHRRPVVEVQWHRGWMDRDFALRNDRDWYRRGPFLDDGEGIESFMRALESLEDRAARSAPRPLSPAPQAPRP